MTSNKNYGPKTLLSFYVDFQVSRSLDEIMDNNTAINIQMTTKPSQKYHIKDNIEVSQK